MRAQVHVLPELFLERLRRVIPVQCWDSVVNSFTVTKPTTFRVNIFKSTPEKVREELSSAGLRVERVPWYEQAMILRGGRLRDLQETESYRNGSIYVQSLSSMLPPLALSPLAGESVLDLCAAPGSKTTQLSCLMRGEGRIVANDNNKVRFFKLRANVIQQGASNVELSMRDGELFGRRCPEAFDRVLVDAQCSAEGRFVTCEPKSFSFWKPIKIREMVRKQKRLLASGISSLRPGGILVYSTCTFAPEENEGVINWAIERFGDAIKLEPISLGFLSWMPGLVKWEGNLFSRSVANTIRILPTADMEGFFIAKFLKSKV